MRATLDVCSLEVLRKTLGAHDRLTSIVDRNWTIFAEWSRDGWGPTAAILAERHGLAHGNQIGAICDQLLLECTDLTRRAHMRLDGIQVADASVSQRCPPYNVRRLARKIA